MFPSRVTGTFPFTQRRSGNQSRCNTIFTKTKMSEKVRCGILMAIQSCSALRGGLSSSWENTDTAIVHQYSFQVKKISLWIQLQIESPYDAMIPSFFARRVKQSSLSPWKSKFYQRFNKSKLTQRPKLTETRAFHTIVYAWISAKTHV